MADDTFNDSLFDAFDTQENNLNKDESIEYESDGSFDLNIIDETDENKESFSDENNITENISEQNNNVSENIPKADNVKENTQAPINQNDEYGSQMIPTVDIADIDEDYSDNDTVVEEETNFSTDDDIDDIDVIENDPDFSGDELAVENQIDMNTEDTKEDDNFMSFDEANKLDGKNGKKKKSGLQQLNKKKIITIGFSVFCALGLFLILKPESWTVAKKEEKKKPVASKTSYTDYEGRATNSEPMDVPRPQFDENGVNSTYTENSSNVDLREEAYKDAYASQQGSSSQYSGGGTTVEIPDTRNDRLQGKTIAGIKGLTSTQETYATDYELTKIKNSEEAAASSLSKNSSNLKNMDPSSFTSQMLSSMNTSSYTTQNDQSGKQGFYSNGRGLGGNGMWLGLNTIWQGTIFDVILTSEINTDLPGEVTGRVSKNVYSSQDGRYLLIPQNSVLIGNYNSSISYSQSRAQVIWHTLIRPDGYQISLGGMNGTDTKGASGLKGFVNDHPMAYVKAILLMSTFSIINGEFQSTQAETNNQYVQNIAANSQEMVNKLGEKLIDRAMDVQPTIVIKAGTQVNVVVNQNLTLPEYKKPEVKEKYMRGKLPRELY